MTKQKKNGNGQDTVKENRKKYMITAVAVLIAVSVIFLAVVLTGRPSSGEQAPSKELLAEQIAADAAIPGSVETTFLKLDEQGNAVFSGRIVQDGKTLFSCNEMILTADTLKIKDAEITDPAENVLFYLHKLCADGKNFFRGSVRKKSNSPMENCFPEIFFFCSHHARSGTGMGTAPLQSASRKNGS